MKKTNPAFWWRFGTNDNHSSHFRRLASPPLRDADRHSTVRLEARLSRRGPRSSTPLLAAIFAVLGSV